MGTPDLAYRFDDGDAYERYMGRWSRAACADFLPWIAAPHDATWLDVGCGTGALTAAILASAEPASVAAIDPASAQVELARRQVASPRVRFEVADACALPFAGASFDVVASALVLNFIPDRPKALAEMHRVLRPGGIVAAFVWDFAEDGSPSGPVRRALRAVGTPVPDVPGSADSRLDAMRSLFAAAGFGEIEGRTIEVTQRFASRDEFWNAQATGYSPSAGLVKRLSPAQREEAKARVGHELREAADGTVPYTARANAVKATKR